ncbi:TetR/AcrR family transcriptional regulator [Schlesneria paludicola]|uniref:TetR/AcrR family transcriptional regulator n=1 Tax=Schlesneria paludicola TaxID=360056 RepID=UPI00029A4EB8|nr:TetR/AcrR family transcriptional regulator [Schlesneria paludicola]
MKRTATPDRIIDSAFQTFSQRGVLKSSLEDVATAAGLTRVTIYRHFSNKEALVAAVCQRILRPFAHAAAMGPTVTMKQYDNWLLELLKELRDLPVSQFLPCLAEIQNAFPDIHREFRRQRESAIEQIFQNAMRVVREAGYWREELNPLVVQVIFRSSVIGLGENPQIVSADISYEELCLTVIDVFRYGTLKADAR